MARPTDPIVPLHHLQAERTEALTLLSHVEARLAELRPSAASETLDELQAILTDIRQTLG